MYKTDAQPELYTFSAKDIRKRIPVAEEKQPGGAAMREGFESRGGSGRIGRVQPCALPFAN